MAKKRFLVVEDSFIGMQLIKADDKKIVEIETDPEAGGMIPGSNLLEVDEQGVPVVAAAKSKAKRTATSHNDGTAGGGGTPPAAADAKDLA